MSGHSKWHSIKHKKGAADQKRGQIFTKISNAISIAAKLGGGDQAMNPRLELAVAKAKEVNMPKDRIDQAIKRGTGEIEGVTIESATYEAYGPFGIALIIEVITSNKNRVLPELRRLLSENGGKIASVGSVNYLFEQKGLIDINTEGLDQSKKEELELAAIDSGALDVNEIDNVIEVYTNPRELNQIKTKLEAAGFKIESMELIMDPKTTVPITDKTKAQQIIDFIGKLEELEDIDKVHSNFEIAEGLV